MSEHPEPNSLTPEEAAFRRLALHMNQIEENSDYAIGTADGTVTLFKAISDDERRPSMELVYNNYDEWEAVYV